MQTTDTRHDDAAKVWEELGAVRFAVRLQGEELGTVELAVDREWDDESDGYRYEIESDDASNGCDEAWEARSIIAEQIRSIRNGTMDERAERDNESARDFVEALIDDGKAADVLRALRAAKLI